MEVYIMAHILVTGGNGALGREIVPRLVETGHTARIMSRHPHPSNLPPGTEWAQANLETGQGIREAVSGIDTIIHAATSVVRHTQQIDLDGTRLLLEQARTAGVSHVIYVSIVGIDRIPFPYYRHKLAAEAVIEGAGIPLSILRATQFHYLLDLFLSAFTKSPLLTLLPTDFKFQPITTSEVASRLCKIVATEPAGRLPDIGGPQVHPLGELAHTWLTIRNLHRTIIHLPLPGQVAQGFRRGYNTCPDHPFGTITWTQWLHQKYSPNMSQENFPAT